MTDQPLTVPRSAFTDGALHGNVGVRQGPASRPSEHEQEAERTSGAEATALMRLWTSVNGANRRWPADGIETQLRKIPLSRISFS